MNRLLLSILGCLSMLSSTAFAQKWNAPDEFSNVSPQVGGTTAPSGGLFTGIIASKYFETADNVYVGGGAGVYLQGGEAVGEVLLKLGVAGILGASVGPSFSESGGVTVTNDLWLNALVAGLRWRMDHREEGTIHSVALFVPLGIWIEELQ